MDVQEDVDGAGHHLLGEAVELVAVDRLVRQQRHQQLERSRLQVRADGEDAAAGLVVGHAGGQVEVAGRFLEPDEGGAAPRAVVRPQERTHGPVRERARERRQGGPHLRLRDHVDIHAVVEKQRRLPHRFRGFPLIEVFLQGGPHPERVAVRLGGRLDLAWLHERQVAEREHAPRQHHPQLCELAGNRDRNLVVQPDQGVPGHVQARAVDDEAGNGHLDDARADDLHPVHGHLRERVTGQGGVLRQLQPEGGVQGAQGDRLNAAVEAHAHHRSGQGKLVLVQPLCCCLKGADGWRGRLATPAGNRQRHHECRETDDQDALHPQEPTALRRRVTPVLTTRTTGAPSAMMAA